MSDDFPLDTTDSHLIRILDVNANRATEGLRVTEEFLRFQRQDGELCKRCKALRHEVSQTVMRMASAEQRAACRSTDTDVGTLIGTAAEYQRADAGHIAAANLKRATESLRVLEEFGKLISPEIAQQFERLRYEAYTLEKSLGHLARGSRLLGHAQLYVLVDGSFGYQDVFWNRVTSLLQSSVDVVQLRDKHATDRVLIEVASQLTKLCQTHDKLFVVNDRADLARVAAAPALHVGQDEISVADARRVVGANALIGVSTHSLAQARQAVRDGADYIGVGPVFPSQTKHFSAHVGIQLIQDVAPTIEIPCFAIGGIDADRLAHVVDAGARRVAVSAAVWKADDVALAANRFKEQLVNLL